MIISVTQKLKIPFGVFLYQFSHFLFLLVVQARSVEGSNHPFFPVKMSALLASTWLCLRNTLAYAMNLCELTKINFFVAFMGFWIFA